MEKEVIPVILAGGNGTRLWPVSRESYPKQFCQLLDEDSLLQKTMIRARAVSNHSDIIVITNDAHYFLCKDQLEALGFKNNIHYILEPCGKNTAPAIAMAAIYAKKYIAQDPTLLVLPSDHYLEDYSTFKNIVKKATDFADQNQLVVFGVQPTAPKTGYGYIKQGKSLGEDGFKVSHFIEKPSLEIAKQYLSQGDFYWNSGIFLFKAKEYLSELDALSNDIYKQCTTAFYTTEFHHDFFRVDKTFNACRSASIDYEVMEKTDKAVMLPLIVPWDDLGCWLSVAERAEADNNGNVCRGNVTVSESQNCFVSSEQNRVIAIGISDQIVVSTSDAILIVNKAYSQSVKKIVEQLKLQRDPIATEHKRIYRPWGFFERISSGPGYQVKYLMINPGASISLQLHHHRSEHWIVVSGEAGVIKGEEAFYLQTNQSIHVPKETKHRLSNIGSQLLTVIEVQHGDYLGEDDIVRLDDVYERTTKANLAVEVA